MKQLLKTLGIQLGVFFMLILGAGIVYAAWDDTVSTGTPLTADNWNKVLDRVKLIGTTDVEDVIAIGLAGGLNRPLSFGWADNTIYHRIRSAGVGNTGIAWDLKDSLANFLFMPEYISFIFDGQSKFTVLENGNVGIGTSNPDAMLTIESATSTRPSLTLKNTSGTNRNSFLSFVGSSAGETSTYNIFQWSSGQNLHFSVNDNGVNKDLFRLKKSDQSAVFYGNVSTPGNVTAVSFQNTSDARLKENTAPIANAVDIISQLRGVSFRWKDSGKEDVGFIAQEVEQVLPEIVSTNELGMKTVDYARMTPILIEALKELQEQNKVLVERIEILENQKK